MLTFKCSLYGHFVYKVGLERIPSYRDNYPQTSRSVSLYLGTRLMFEHAQKPNTREIKIAIKWQLISVLLCVISVLGL